MTRHPRARPRSSHATAAVILAALAAGAGAVTVVGACLPELDPLNAPTPQTPLEASSSTHIGQYCGDGLIQLLDDGGDAGESCDPGPGAATDNGAISGCNACQVTCPAGGSIDPETNHCYFLLAPTSQGNDAKEACANAGAHVVTMDSEREESFVHARVGDAGPFWIGLGNSGLENGYVTAPTPPEPPEPGYPTDPTNDPCPGCFGGSPDAGALPSLDDAGGEQLCLVETDGRWHKTLCNDPKRKFATLCEREPPGQRGYSCGGELCTTVPFTFGTKRYLFDLTPVSADQAAQACRGLPSGGGQLVLLDSAEEREELMREIQLIVSSSADSGASPPKPTVWIGLHQDDGGAGWVWDDGKDGGVRAIPWGSAEPAIDSGTRAFLRVRNLYDTELAASDDDSAPRYQLCERPAVPDAGP